MKTKNFKDGLKQMISGTAKDRSREPTVFEHQLEQFKVELETTQENAKKSKELRRYIRNLEAIIAFIKRKA